MTSHEIQYKQHTLLNQSYVKQYSKNANLPLAENYRIDLKLGNIWRKNNKKTKGPACYVAQLVMIMIALC